MIIEATGLRKSFTIRRGRGRGREGGRERRAVEAVRGVDLSVAEGETFGFLGPNGAGKTTTVRMLATLLRPDSGAARVAGHDLLAEPRAVRARIGYVSQAGGVDDGATVRANLLLQAGLCRMPSAAARRRAAELLDALELSGLGERTARTLSGGQRRRLALAIGLVHGPRLLFLDEPTIGLDPQGRARLWAEVGRLRAGGTAVFLTTHYLDEADALCDRLAIIDRGTVVAEGTPAALKREIAGDVVTLRFRGDGGSAGSAGSAAWLSLVREALSGLGFVRDLQAAVGDGADGAGELNAAEGAEVRVYVDSGEETLPLLLRAVDRAGLSVASSTLTRPSLDDVFLNRTGRSLRDAAEPAAA
jgi:ABC-2 type transport system ATP-binding protein